MLETVLTAFTTFFAVIGPIDTAVLLASMTPNMTRAERRAIAVKAVLIATIIILAVRPVRRAGAAAARRLARRAPDRGRHHPVHDRAGDDARQATRRRRTLSVKESEEAESKAEHHAEIAVFPFATPLLAGPGAMTSAIVLAASTKGDLELLGAVIAAILAVMAVTLVLFLLAQEIHQLIGVTARKVIVRVFGVLLAALAVQSIFNGLAEAHIFG